MFSVTCLVLRVTCLVLRGLLSVNVFGVACLVLRILCCVFCVTCFVLRTRWNKHFVLFIIKVSELPRFTHQC